MVRPELTPLQLSVGQNLIEAELTEYCSANSAKEVPEGCEIGGDLFAGKCLSPS